MNLPMNKVLRYGLQILFYALFMAAVWYFSIKPAYHQLDTGQAVITLSFIHATKVREPCRKLTQEELMKLAPNMRLQLDCPRERSPLVLEMYLDETLITKVQIEPPGFHKDQSVSFFERVKVTAGEHKLRIWMNDDVKVAGVVHHYEQLVSLKPEQLLLVDFDAQANSFVTK